MVHLLPHWTWPGKEGKVIPVWTYSNAEEVELFLNDQSLGAKSNQGQMNLSWFAIGFHARRSVLVSNEGEDWLSVYCNSGAASATRRLTMVSPNS